MSPISLIIYQDISLWRYKPSHYRYNMPLLALLPVDMGIDQRLDLLMLLMLLPL